MKPRKGLVRRTPLKQGKPLEQHTELRRGAPIKSRRSNPQADRVGSSPARSNANGPVKKRLESSEIPKAIRLAVLERDGYSCVRCGRYLVDTIRYGLQHRLPRRAGGSRRRHTMANLVTLCGWTVDKGTCTEAVELLDRKRAEAEGWLVPDGIVTPEEWPVLRWTPDGLVWMQPGETWTPAEPHERQREMGAAA